MGKSNSWKEKPIHFRWKHRELWTSLTLKKHALEFYSSILPHLNRLKENFTSFDCFFFFFFFAFDILECACTSKQIGLLISLFFVTFYFVIDTWDGIKGNRF